MKRAAIAAMSACLMTAPVWAVNKCTIDGQIVFQDTACPGKGETIKVSPASGHATAVTANEGAARARAELDAVNRKADIRAAIERGEPLIGMTETELLQAMGPPGRANLANYNGTPHNQLIYERGGRTLYVYTDGGVVKAIQNTESIGSARQQAVRCPTPLEIRAMETSASSNSLSVPEKVERLKQIGEAKKCGR